MSNHESSVLKPRDPAIVNSDDWPIFAVKNALVFDPLQSNADPCNLLHAGAYRPLTISGKLESLPKDTAHLLVKPSYHRTQPIEITNVRQFSYGQYEDGSVDIWAAGDAGWFTIIPSRAYKDIYVDMVQAVQLLYFTADSHKESGTKPANIEPHHLFQKYCREHPDTCTTPADAANLYAYHRYFLFSSMLDRKEGVPWSRTPLFKYLDLTFPDDTALIRQRRAFAMKPPKPPSSKGGTSSPVPSNASLKRKRKDRAETPALLPIGRSKSRSASVTTVTPSVAGSFDPPASRPRSQRASLRSSQQPASVTVQSQSNESDADSDTSAGGNRAHKGKSSLRPKSSKYLQVRQVAKGLPDGNDADDDETDEPHGAVITSPSSKRKMLDDLRPRRTKRRNSEMPPDDHADHVEGMDLSVGDEGSEFAMTPAEAFHDADESMLKERTPTLPFRFRDGASAEDEGDVWRCTTDGCMHRIYAASEPASMILVEDHQRVHKYDEDQRVKLVRRMQAPWLPVGRLMGRVRELAAQDGAPPPIVQRY